MSGPGHMPGLHTVSQPIDVSSQNLKKKIWLKLSSVEVENLCIIMSIKTRWNYPPYWWPFCIVPMFFKYLMGIWIIWRSRESSIHLFWPCFKWRIGKVKWPKVVFLKNPFSSINYVNYKYMSWDIYDWNMLIEFIKEFNEAFPLTSLLGKLFKTHVLKMS